MVRGRRQAKRENAHARDLEAHEQEERERRDAEEHAAMDRRLARKWGNEASALNRLGALSRELEKLHREEARLLHERDELVQWLRREGQSWAMLGSRTNLSRQALMKRMTEHRAVSSPGPRGDTRSSGTRAMTMASTHLDEPDLHQWLTLSLSWHSCGTVRCDTPCIFMSENATVPYFGQPKSA